MMKQNKYLIKLLYQKFDFGQNILPMIQQFAGFKILDKTTISSNHFENIYSCLPCENAFGLGLIEYTRSAAVCVIFL